MRSWLIGEKTYEGLPLLLRRPANLDLNSLRSTFPILVVVKHTFANCQSDGLPEPDYNDGLAEMDYELITAFDANDNGVPVLIETYGGKRLYYFYVAAKCDVDDVLSPVADRHLEKQLSWSVHSDPDWSFIAGYAREHFPTNERLKSGR